VYRIEKNVEMWKGRRGSTIKKNPFGEMEVDDSFFVPYGDVEHCATPFLTVQGSAYGYGRRHDKKFAVRICHEPKGYRV
jgi:hypothetical protein